MNLFSYGAVLLVGLGIGFYLAANVRPGENSRNLASNISITSGGEKIVVETPKLGQEKQKIQEHEILRSPELVLGPVEKFEKAMMGSNFEEAQSALREIENREGRSKVYFESFGRFLGRTRNWEEAKDNSKRCLTEFPGSQSCLVDLASAELEIGSKKEQSNAVRACLNNDPKNPECQNISGIVRMNEGNYNEAVSIYENLIRDNGSYGFRFNGEMLDWQMGLALEGAGRYAEASKYFYSACEKNFADACGKYEEVRHK